MQQQVAKTKYKSSVIKIKMHRSETDLPPKKKLKTHRIFLEKKSMIMQPNLPHPLLHGLWNKTLSRAFLMY